MNETELHYRLLEAVNTKVDALDQKFDAGIAKLATEMAVVRKDLAVHKEKTSRLSLLVGGAASLLVAVAAVLLKGCV